MRSHWKIENGQHHRRDRTQNADRCPEVETNTARGLSLFRSLTVFLHEQQRRECGGKKSLPDYERHTCRQPGGLVRRFMSPPA
ncbi:MAG: hypothetical protein H7A47_09480 [Verrucomicrobiales bacterium]|nr:hypothetical protein [Verrucomicrobiales bacterium]